MRRGSNVYGFVSPAPFVDTGVTTVSTGPKEHHYQGLLELQSNLGRGLVLNLQGGIDFIRNAYFVQGRSINPGILKINLSWYPYLRSR